MSSVRPRALSPAQIAVLHNLAAGRDSAHGLVGRSAHGAHYGVVASLMKRGLVSDDRTITDAGREVLK